MLSLISQVVHSPHCSFPFLCRNFFILQNPICQFSSLCLLRSPKTVSMFQNIYFFQQFKSFSFYPQFFDPFLIGFYFIYYFQFRVREHSSLHLLHESVQFPEDSPYSCVCFWCLWGNICQLQRTWFISGISILVMSPFL